MSILHDGESRSELDSSACSQRPSCKGTPLNLAEDLAEAHSEGMELQELLD